MLSATENLPAAKPVPALTRALHWSMEGLRWWRRAPWMLLWLCLLQLLAETVLQLLAVVFVVLQAYGRASASAITPAATSIFLFIEEEFLWVVISVG